MHQVAPPLADLLDTGTRRLLDVAAEVVEQVTIYFQNRPLDSTPVDIEAKVAVWSHYSTPELALHLEAVDPSGERSYDSFAWVTGSAITRLSATDDTPVLFVDDGGHQFQPDDQTVAGIALFAAELLNEHVPTDDDEEEL